MTVLTSAVAGAVDAVQGHFAGKPVEVIPDGAGGAFVIISGIEAGARYTPTATWLASKSTRLTLRRTYTPTTPGGWPGPTADRMARPSSR